MSCPTEPEPRDRLPATGYTPLSWPISARFGFASPAPPPSRPFVDVLGTRHSSASLSPVSLREVANFLAYVTSPRASWVSNGLPRSSRAAASSGALHGIEIVVVAPGPQPRLFRFCADPPSLDLLKLHARGPAERLIRRTRIFKPDSHGLALVLIADVDLYAAAYDRYETLMWRDSGALLQTLYLCAQAYRLGFCALGMHGAEAVEAIWPESNRRVVAVGTAVIGRWSAEG